MNQSTRVLLDLLDEHEKMASIIVELYDVCLGGQINPKTLHKISLTTDSVILSGVVFNQKTPRVLLKTILKHCIGADVSDSETRVHIAYHPSLFEKDLFDLINNDISQEVVEASIVALAIKYSKNLNISANSLDMLHSMIQTKICNENRRQKANKLLSEHPKFKRSE